MNRYSALQSKPPHPRGQPKIGIMRVEHAQTGWKLTCRVHLEVLCAIVGSLHALVPKELLQGDKIRLLDLVLEYFQPNRRSRYDKYPVSYGFEKERAPTSSCPWFRILNSRAFSGPR